jgi:hypothetical protein
MRTSHGSRLLSAATLVGSLAALSACGQSGADLAGPTAVASTVIVTLDTVAREIPVGASLVVLGGVSVASSG